MGDSNPPEIPIVIDIDMLEDNVPTTEDEPAILEPPQQSIQKETNAAQFYAMVQDTIANRLTVDVLIFKLNELQSIAPNRNEFLDSLADALVQCDTESSYCPKEQRDTLLGVIKTIMKTGILPARIALERFEIDTNASMGIITDKKQFMVSYNRLRTRLYFKQKKYNLFREENEGFAKILTVLAQLDSSNVQDTLATVSEIIGRYRVDPNRVLDLLLEVLEYDAETDSDCFVDFLKLFYNNPSKITQLITLKLNFQAIYRAPEQAFPQSFYRLIAILIQQEILDLDDIYPHLCPTDAKILEYHKKLVDEGRSLARKYATAVVGEERQTKSVIDELSDEDRYILEIENQKVNICAHLIDIGDWDQALLLAKKLPEYYCFSHRRVATSACDLINYLIDPIYRECALPKPLNSRIRQIPARKFGPQQIKSISDLPTCLFPKLTALGPFLSADILLLTKMIRILRHTLLQKHGDQDVITAEGPLYFQILDIINDSILPSTSLSSSNPSLARELWTLIRIFKYQIRYKLYFNWRDEGSNPAMLRNRGQILLRAKHHMKRLSKETCRVTGRHLAKLCSSNPVITLNYILVQIQSYDNLIGMVVDALRFVPPIAIDTLLYCIIESLQDPHKNKKSFDGMALAQWLTSLSSFSANIILRYKVEFAGFLEYIANQLRSGSSLNLVLLTDLVQKMTGIETIQAITDDRIEALMGGDVLRTEGAYFNQVKNTRKSSARLKDALIESRLAMPLCILIAQMRDSFFLKKHDGTPLKLIGKLYDQCQETLVQYGVFLSMNLSIDDYINFLPPVDMLMTEYKLDPDSAFFLARPMIFHKIKSKFLELKESASKELPAEEGEAAELSIQTIGIKFVEAARSVIDPIATAIQPSLLEKYGTNNLNSKLFVIFWTLSMSDIEVPLNCYEREIQRLKTTLNEFGKSNDDDPKKRKERERCNNLIQKLRQEQAEQIEHTGFVRMYMDSEKNSLFSAAGDSLYFGCRQFAQHCPFARSILSASDAIYSARFLLFLHELKVADYPTIICLDRLLCDVTYMMGACTENEANHYGRFLCNILKTTAFWHSDASVFNEQCEHHPGSIINAESAYITYDNYRDICFKWQYRLTRAFSVALESNNYVQIRNALIVMISIIDYYPAIKHFGKGIGMKIEDVRNNEKETRQDLYALATAYAGRLDEKKPHLITEGDFHHVDSRRKGDSNSNSKSANNNNNGKKESSSSTQQSKTSASSNNSSEENHHNHTNSNSGGGEITSRRDSPSRDSQKTESHSKRTSDISRSSSSSRPQSRPSSKTRPASPPQSSHRERHSSSSSRKRARHS